MQDLQEVQELQELNRVKAKIENFKFVLRLFFLLPVALSPFVLNFASSIRLRLLIACVLVSILLLIYQRLVLDRLISDIFYRQFVIKKTLELNELYKATKVLAENPLIRSVDKQCLVRVKVEMDKANEIYLFPNAKWESCSVFLIEITGQLKKCHTRLSDRLRHVMAVKAMVESDAPALYRQIAIIQRMKDKQRLLESINLLHMVQVAKDQFEYEYNKTQPDWYLLNDLVGKMRSLCNSVLKLDQVTYLKYSLPRGYKKT